MILKNIKTRNRNSGFLRKILSPKKQPRLRENKKIKQFHAISFPNKIQSL